MRKRKTDFQKAKEAAIGVIIKHSINSFPIDILAIMDTYEDLKVVTYSELAQKHGCTVKEIATLFGSSDGAIHYKPKINKYIISYNDEIEVDKRIYWTLAHEFGHYILSHLGDSKKTSLKRYSVSSSEYDSFEVEANFFARYLLAPPTLIANVKMSRVHQISESFHVSKSVAQNTLSYINDGKRKGFKYRLNEPLKSLFTPFISTFKSCPGCNNILVGQHTFCKLCGLDTEISQKGKDMKKLFYSKVDTNFSGLPHSCPVCENENIIGDYCQVCGIYLINKCLGTTYNHEYFLPLHSYSGCEGQLDGDARYCTKCGAPSSFNISGILVDWRNEKSEISDDPFSKENVKIPF